VPVGLRMTEIGIDLDYAQELDQLSKDRLIVLATRIGRSTTPEQLIYRELEIDQVWRLLDQGEDVAGLAPSLQQDLTQQIEYIHDLVGVHHDARKAAATLRAALAERSSRGH
jgi:hypothetical protein